MSVFIRKMIQVAFDLPIDIQHGAAGMVYVTSPLVAGLLIAEHTEEDALRRVPEALAELVQATKPGNPMPAPTGGK